LELEALQQSHRAPATFSMLAERGTEPPYNTSATIAQRERVTTHSAETQTTPRRRTTESPEGVGRGLARPPLPPASLLPESWDFPGASSGPARLSPLPQAAPPPELFEGGGPDYYQQLGFNARPMNGRHPMSTSLGNSLTERASLGGGGLRPASPYDFAPVVRNQHRLGLGAAGSTSTPTFPPVPPPSGDASGWPWVPSPASHAALQHGFGRGIGSAMPGSGTAPNWPDSPSGHCTPEAEHRLRGVSGAVGRGNDSASGGKSPREDRMLMRAYEVYRQQQLDLMRAA